jgi:signal transduction histidine kinase
MALSLNAPVEDLKLSNRVRNVLRLSGLHTIGSVLQCDYKAALRGFGLGARAELARTLKSNGFTPPASLNPSEIDDNGSEISKLFGQIETSFQKWISRIQHFEMRIGELTAKGSTRQRPATEVAEDAHQTAPAVLASEFRTRLRAIRSASAALRDVAELSSQQQELVALVEEGSLRLSLLAGRLIETLPPEKLPPCLTGRANGELQRAALRTHAIARLVAAPELQQPKLNPASAVRLDEVPCSGFPDESRPHV